MNKGEMKSSTAETYLHAAEPYIPIPWENGVCLNLLPLVLLVSFLPGWFACNFVNLLKYWKLVWEAPIISSVIDLQKIKLRLRISEFSKGKPPLALTQINSVELPWKLPSLFNCFNIIIQSPQCCIILQITTQYWHDWLGEDLSLSIYIGNHNLMVFTYFFFQIDMDFIRVYFWWLTTLDNFHSTFKIFWR